MKKMINTPLSWAVFSKIAESIIRFSSNLILTKILFPEAFGLMATAQVILSLIDLFTDLGIRTSLIQNENGEKKEYLNTAWSISVSRGFIIFGILFLAAPFLSDFYNEPRLTMIIRMLSISIIVQAFSNPALSLLFRKLETLKQFYWEIGSQFTGFVLTIVIAILFPSVWAMISGYILTSIIRLILSYWLIPYLPKWEIAPAAKKQLLSFGKHILVNTLTTWMFFNIDKLLVSKLFGVKEMGSYIIGLNIALVVEQMVIQLFYKIMFPTFSRLAGKPEILKQKLFNYSGIMTLVTSAALALLYVSSDSIVQFLYGTSYSLAALIIGWMAIRSIFHLQFGIFSSYLISVGKPVFVSISTTGGLMVFGILFLISGSGLSLIHFLMILIVSSFSMMMISLYYVDRHLHTGYRNFLENSMKSAVIFLTVIFISNGIGLLQPYLRVSGIPENYFNTALTFLLSSPVLFFTGKSAYLKWNSK